MNIRKVSPNGVISSNAPVPLSRNGVRNLAQIAGRASGPTSQTGSLITVPGSGINEYIEGSFSGSS